jgi:hypothetical protein
MLNSTRNYNYKCFKEISYVADQFYGEEYFCEAEKSEITGFCRQGMLKHLSNVSTNASN